MKTLKEFDHKKAVQSINYLADKEGGSIDKMKAIKLIYLAERYHLRKYGRPIVNDTYWAMSYGPVGSSVKDIIELSQFLSPEELVYTSKYILRKPNSHSIFSTVRPHKDVFSDSDIESLDFAYSKFGKMKQFDLAKLTHEYPEWKKFEQSLKSKATTREHMSYIDFFENPSSLENDLFSMGKNELESSRDIFLDSYKIANSWC